MSSPHAQHWDLDPAFAFLNHGSFGACPRVVLERQSELRAQLEAQPVRFYVREYEALLEQSRAALGELVGARPEGLAFVRNATAGVNAVLRSYPLRSGDQVLMTDHEYNACANTLHFVAERSGAELVVAELPFPCASADELVDALLARVTPRTRLLLVDHVTSHTALVMPIERIVGEMRERDIDVLVDGAHAPGMLPLELDALGAAYYTGNCHKWLCTPKGAALLWVREDKRAELRPTSISHGANSMREDRARYQLEFDWTGTDDPTAVMSIPRALEFLRGLVPGGLPGLRAHNRELCLRARRLLCERLEVELPCPDELIGSMAALVLPDGQPGDLQPPLFLDPVHEALHQRGIEVPVSPWPLSPGRALRISTQAYNDYAQYEALADALCEELARVPQSAG